MVADNRMSIGQALAAKRAEESRSRPAPSRSTVGRRIAIVWLGLVAVALIFLRPQAGPAQSGIVGILPRDPIAIAPDVPPPVATVRLGRPEQTSRRQDAAGQIVEISGPDPQSVLVAYCQGGTAGTRKPIEILPAVPPDPAQRLGLLRTFSEEGTSLRVISIRKDPETEAWVAGNGSRPIISGIPPPQPPGTRGVAVSLD
jgi:hypothetical protein